jgi:hypothetical protein
VADLPTFHQDFWPKSRAAFAQVIFDAFNSRQTLVKKHKIMATFAKLQT